LVLPATPEWVKPRFLRSWPGINAIAHDGELKLEGVETLPLADVAVIADFVWAHGQTVAHT
jgi:hypothetical protein